MRTTAILAILSVAAGAGVANEGAVIRGEYVEARTCDVWTGPCFANADFNINGKNAVMAWKIDKGTFDNVALDGLGMVAVISASNPLGQEQTGPARAILIVDRKATSAQRQALVRLAQAQGGRYLKNVAAVQTAPVDIVVCSCKGGSCAEVTAGAARIKTRCLDSHHDKACEIGRAHV